MFACGGHKNASLSIMEPTSAKMALWLPPDTAGWLDKESSKSASWKSQYFVLKGSNLFWFKDNTARSPAGLVSLESAAVLAAVPPTASGAAVSLAGATNSTRPYGILIRLHEVYHEACGRGDLLVCATSHEQLVMWLRAMHQASIPRPDLLASLKGRPTLADILGFTSLMTPPSVSEIMPSGGTASAHAHARHGGSSSSHAPPNNDRLSPASEYGSIAGVPPVYTEGDRSDDSVVTVASSDASYASTYAGSKYSRREEHHHLLQHSHRRQHSASPPHKNHSADQPSPRHRRPDSAPRGHASVRPVDTRHNSKLHHVQGSVSGRSTHATVMMDASDSISSAATSIASTHIEAHAASALGAPTRHVGIPRDVGDRKDRGILDKIKEHLTAWRSNSQPCQRSTGVGDDGCDGEGPDSSCVCGDCLGVSPWQRQFIVSGHEEERTSNSGAALPDRDVLSTPLSAPAKDLRLHTAPTVVTAQPGAARAAEANRIRSSGKPRESADSYQQYVAEAQQYSGVYTDECSEDEEPQAPGIHNNHNEVRQQTADGQRRNGPSLRLSHMPIIGAGGKTLARFTPDSESLRQAFVAGVKHDRKGRSGRAHRSRDASRQNSTQYSECFSEQNNEGTGAHVGGQISSPRSSTQAYKSNGQRQSGDRSPHQSLHDKHLQVTAHSEVLDSSKHHSNLRNGTHTELHRPPMQTAPTALNVGVNQGKQLSKYSPKARSDSGPEPASAHLRHNTASSKAKSLSRISEDRMSEADLHMRRITLTTSDGINLLQPQQEGGDSTRQQSSNVMLLQQRTSTGATEQVRLVLQRNGERMASGDDAMVEWQRRRVQLGAAAAGPAPPSLLQASPEHLQSTEAARLQQQLEAHMEVVSRQGGDTKELAARLSTLTRSITQVQGTIESSLGGLQQALVAAAAAQQQQAAAAALQQQQLQEQMQLQIQQSTLQMAAKQQAAMEAAAEQHCAQLTAAAAAAHQQALEMAEQQQLLQQQSVMHAAEATKRKRSLAAQQQAIEAAAEQLRQQQAAAAMVSQHQIWMAELQQQQLQQQQLQQQLQQQQLQQHVVQNDINTQQASLSVMQTLQHQHRLQHHHSSSSQPNDSNGPHVSSPSPTPKHSSPVRSQLDMPGQQEAMGHHGSPHPNGLPSALRDGSKPSHQERSNSNVNCGAPRMVVSSLHPSNTSSGFVAGRETSLATQQPFPAFETVVQVALPLLPTPPPPSIRAPPPPPLLPPPPPPAPPFQAPIASVQRTTRGTAQQHRGAVLTPAEALFAEIRGHGKQLRRVERESLVLSRRQAELQSTRAKFEEAQAAAGATQQVDKSSMAGRWAVDGDVIVAPEGGSVSQGGKPPRQQADKVGSASQNKPGSVRMPMPNAYALFTMPAPDMGAMRGHNTAAGVAQAPGWHEQLKAQNLARRQQMSQVVNNVSGH